MHGETGSVIEGTIHSRESDGVSDTPARQEVTRNFSMRSDGAGNAAPAQANDVYES
jgi:hypothetical protein